MNFIIFDKTCNLHTIKETQNHLDASDILYCFGTMAESVEASSNTEQKKTILQAFHRMFFRNYLNKDALNTGL